MSVAGVDYDILLKVIVIGPQEAGKSTLVARYANRPIPERYFPTIGIEIALHAMELDGKRIKMQIWDYAGHARFRTMSSSFSRGAHAAIALFDVTNLASFTGVRTWLNETTRNLLQTPLFLVACKCDDVSARVISQEVAQSLAFEYNASYHEASALRNEGLDKLFENVVRAILHQLGLNHALSPPLQPDVG